MKPIKILIVEDDPHILRMLTGRLKQSGYDIISASNGEDGLAKAITHKPQLILLDLMLPKLSGEELCKAVKEHDDERVANIPIIVLTAKGTEVDKVICKVIGASNFITKPFEASELLTHIDTALKAA